MKRLPIIFTLAFALASIASLPVHAGATLSAQSATELSETYGHLVNDFYKKVDTQAALDGAHTGLVAYLKAQGITASALHTVKATSDDGANVRALEHEVQEAIDAYGTKVPQAKLTYAAISGVLGSVHDKYTVFLDPNAYSELNAGLDGVAFGGVGLSYSIDAKTSTILIENVIIDGPSDRAGLLSDDHIVAIDGKAVKDTIAGAPIDVQQTRIQKLLRGTPGTKVAIAVQRAEGKMLNFTITRELIKPPSVYAKLLPDHVGYAQLSVFGQNTGTELTAALKRLDAEGAKAYILDLRYNGGGYLNAAIDVSSKFIPSGPIVSVQSRAGESTEYDAENTAIAPRPLAVLVNNFSASASEITAGALEDSGVGTLIGTKTYGKGVVQTIFPLKDGSAIKITTARYFTPSGRDINAIGIQPQIVAEIGKEVKIRQGDPSQDPQLQKAMSFLEDKLAAQVGNR
jgi:carboxyl-terminal processing protease